MNLEFHFNWVKVRVILFLLDAKVEFVFWLVLGEFLSFVLFLGVFGFETLSLCKR